MKASEVIYSNLNALFKQKVYPLVRPLSEKGLPYLVYTVLNANALNAVSGYFGRELVYLQLDVYHDNYDGCEDITNQMIQILNENVKPFYYDSRRYMYEDDAKLYRQSIECHIWQVTVPIEGLQVWVYLGENPKLYLNALANLVNVDLPKINR